MEVNTYCAGSITSKGSDTDNPGSEADRGKSAEDQALGEALPGPSQARGAGKQLTLAWDVWKWVKGPGNQPGQVPRRPGGGGSLGLPRVSLHPCCHPALCL